MDSPVAGGFSAFRCTIASPALLAVADHWHQVRAGKQMPAWSDLLPRAIAPYLKQVWAFKYDRATQDFTARLASTRVMMGLGNSFRGTPLKDLYPAPVFQRAQERLSRAVSQPAVFRCSGKLFKIGGQIIEGERIVLPLALDGHHGDGILGATDLQYPAVPGSVELLDDRIEWFSI